MPMTTIELEKAIDDVIAESGLNSAEIADILEAMVDRYREHADEEEGAEDE